MTTKLTNPEEIRREAVVFNERYQVLEILGTGGQGRIFRVADRLDAGRVKVLKAPNGVAGAEAMERLRWEFLRLARLDHARLLRVFDLDVVQASAGGLEAGQVFFTAEYVQGQSPAQVISRLDRASRQDLLWRVATDVASVLDHVHGHGLLHGDVTPQNLICTPEGDVKVLDFGLSTSRSAGPTGHASGTLEYMAPEALAGWPEPRSDLYGLGATLYALASGRPPRPCDAALPLGQRVHALLETRPEPLAEVTKGVPAALAELVDSLLEEDPNRRPDAAASVLARIARRRRSLSLAVAPRDEGLPLLSVGVVGRDELVDQVVTVVSARLEADSDPSGLPQVVVLRGQPGSGRGSVAAEAIRALQTQVARGGLPSFAFVEGQGVAAAAAALLQVGPVSLGDEVGRVRLLAELERFTAERAGVLLVHESGVESEGLRAMFSLVTRDPRVQLGHLAILVCAAHGEDLGLSGWALERDVSPLPREELAELVERALGQAPPAAFVDSLLDASGGLPGVAMELLRAAWAEGLDRRKVPEVDLARLAGQGLERLARARLDRLSPPSMRLAEVLAVAERPIPLSWAAGVAGLDPLDAVAAMESLWVEGMLRRDGDRLALSHGSLSAPLLDSLRGNPARWEQAHVDLANRYAEVAVEGDEAALLAQVEHLRQLTDAPELSVLAHQVATLARERGEWRRAAELLEVAVEAEGASDALLGLELAEARVRAGDYQGGSEVLRSLEASGSGGVALRAATLDALALQRQGDLQAARLRVEQALGEVEAGAAEEHAALVAEGRAIWARVLAEQGDPEVVLSRFPTIEEVPEGVAGLPLLEAVGLAAYYGGQLDRAARLFELGIEGSRQAGDLPHLARALGCDGMVRQALGDLVGASDRYEEAWGLSERLGDLHAAAHFAANLGAVRREQGRLADALDPSVESVRRMVQLGFGAELPIAVYNLGNLLLSLGDLAGVVRELEFLQGALEQGRGTDRMAGYRDLLAAELGRRLRLLGEAPPHRLPDGLRKDPSALARRAVRQFARAGASREEVFSKIAELECLAAEGRGEEAARAISAVRDAVTRMEDSQGRSLLAMAVARVGLAGGIDPELCLPELERACSHLTEAGLAELGWRCETIHAAVLDRAGRREAASVHAETAAELEREQRARVGASYDYARQRDPDLRRLEQLRRRGPGSSAPPSRPWVSLPGERAAQEASVVRRLLEINKRINSELRLPILLELVLDAVLELTDAERGFILLATEEGVLEVRVARNMGGRSLRPEERDLSLSIAEEAAERGAAVVTVDAASDERFSSAVSVHGLRLRSVLAVPLRVKGRVVGTVYVDNRLRKGAFLPSDVALVQDFAEQAAIAIDNARLHQELTARQEEVEGLNRVLEQRVAEQQEELVEVRTELQERQADLKVRYDYSNIVGQTPQMMDLFHLLDRVTDVELPVVLFGESGTGKELVARAIHFNGPRKDRPFVSENCGALPETLLESILFGHVKGAFTGAHRDRKGLFEIASGGTLFLDEVGEMSPAMQTKLLRVLQNGELRRVGGDQVIRVDVRIIAASNRRLDELVAEGAFRQDLFYRLNVLSVSLPPLRARVEDIPLLVEHFLAKYSPDRPRRVGRDAMRRLMAHPWPGNVRELENEVQRMAALGGDLLGRADLSPLVGEGEEAPSRPQGLDLRQHVESVERGLIRGALDRTRGNQTRAARLLGLSRYGLLKKLRRYGMEAKPVRRAAGSDA